MAGLIEKRLAWIAGLLACIGITMTLPAESKGQSAYPPAQPSFGDSLNSGMNKIGQAITPKPVTKPADDPVSLESKGKAGVELYVAVARLYEESGRFPEAEGQYKQALQKWPDDTRALLGYARLKDRMGEPREALKLYQRVIQLYPQQPAVYNDLAVCYCRHGMLREAVAALERAALLRPKELLYRNNMAIVLVELGRPQEAFVQLRAVYDDAVAHYNLGFLLNKKGQKQAAAQEFAIALRINPSMVQARQWLERLGATAMHAAPPPYGYAPAAYSGAPPTLGGPEAMGAGGRPPVVEILRPPPQNALPPGVRPGERPSLVNPPLTPDVPALTRLPPVSRPLPVAPAPPGEPLLGQPPELIAPSGTWQR